MLRGAEPPPQRAALPEGPVQEAERRMPQPFRPRPEDGDVGVVLHIEDARSGRSEDEVLRFEQLHGAPRHLDILLVRERRLSTVHQNGQPVAVGGPDEVHRMRRRDQLRTARARELQQVAEHLVHQPRVQMRIGLVEQHDGPLGMEQGRLHHEDLQRSGSRAREFVGHSPGRLAIRSHHRRRRRHRPLQVHGEPSARFRREEVPLLLVLTDHIQKVAKSRSRLRQRQVSGNRLRPEKRLPDIDTGDRRHIDGTQRPVADCFQIAPLDRSLRAERDQLRVPMQDFEGDPPTIRAQRDPDRFGHDLPPPQEGDGREGNRPETMQRLFHQGIVPLVVPNERATLGPPYRRQFRPQQDRAQQRGLARVVRAGDDHGRGDAETPVFQVPEVPHLDLADHRPAPGGRAAPFGPMFAASRRTGGAIPSSRRRCRRPVCRSRRPPPVRASRGRRTRRVPVRRRSPPR